MPFLADETPASASTTPELLRERPSQEEPQQINGLRESSVNTSTPWEPDCAQSQVRKRKRENCYVQISGLTIPRSQYKGETPLLPITLESEAIQELRSNGANIPSEQNDVLELDNFSVYVPEDGSKYYPGDMRSLHQLKVEGCANELLIDGVLVLNGEKRCIQGVRFGCLSIEGYDADDEVSPDFHIYVQSLVGAKSNVWYKLASPSAEYRRYHDPFLWVARFTKYFVRFLLQNPAVTLNRFRKDFMAFVTENYLDADPAFPRWYSVYGEEDFRQVVNANIGYLWKESYDLDTQLYLEQGLRYHPLWSEVDPKKLTAIPTEESHFDKTAVTPFVYDCFKHMAFASQLTRLDTVDDSVSDARRARRRQMALTPLDSTPTAVAQSAQEPRIIPQYHIREGDVIQIAADMDSAWKSSSANWYAYVERVRKHNNTTKFDVLWLYDTLDTTLGHGYYPYKNELFLSDNCSCGQDAIDITHVLAKIDVRWFVSDPGAQETFFVRQKFRTEATFGAYDFVQLQESDFTCKCENHLSDMDEVTISFAIGDTILVRAGEMLEPAQIVEFCWPTKVTLRTLSRATRTDDKCRPNQLIPTDHTYQVSASQIVRRCHVRFFEDLNSVQAPFDLDGAGDFFYILSTHETAAPGFPPLRQGEFPSTGVSQPLRGLSLFCGGGSLDRGLEEGGAVHFDYVIDWNSPALHTYRANLPDPSKVQLFLGSVNDYIAKSMQGSADPRVAAIGAVDCLAAGSPCPGYSRLQMHKGSPNALLMCSLVASVVSYVDIYTPSYLILENVVGLAGHPPDQKDQNVFSQILCALVAMGYQVQQFLAEPSSYGSCQSRARIFIIATAPGCKPSGAPAQTHASPPKLHTHKKIGVASNGKPFGERKDDISPFNFTSARSAMEDLPDISEGHVRTCIPWPDHRPPKELSALKRQQICMIPRWPHGKHFMYAAKKGLIAQRQMEAYPWQSKHQSSDGSKAWARNYPDYLIGCITTVLRPEDGMNGRSLHWEQQRLMTVMEARRAQSIPDHEVIIGTPMEQWKIVGNGVDRRVAFALGLQLGKAWRETLKERAGEVVSSEVAALSPGLTTNIQPVPVSSVAAPSAFTPARESVEEDIIVAPPRKPISPTKAVPLVWTSPIIATPSSTSIRGLTTTVQVVDLTDESNEPSYRRQSITIQTTIDLTSDVDSNAFHPFVASEAGCSRITDAIDAHTKTKEEETTPERAIVSLPRRSSQQSSVFYRPLVTTHNEISPLQSHHTKKGTPTKDTAKGAATQKPRTTAVVMIPARPLPNTTLPQRFPRPQISAQSSQALQSPSRSANAPTFQPIASSSRSAQPPRTTAPASQSAQKQSSARSTYPTQPTPSTQNTSAPKKKRHSAAFPEFNEFNQWGQGNFQPDKDAAVLRAPQRQIGLRARESGRNMEINWEGVDWDDMEDAEDVEGE